MSHAAVPNSTPEEISSIVLDTNVFVAAGFNTASHAAKIVQAIKEDRIRMVWNEGTRGEILAVLRRIPPLRGFDIADLFRPDTQFTQPTHPEDFEMVSDPDDRKFAALAHAAGAILISRDEHLLEHRDHLGITILSPQEYWATFH
jgi:predicted nucleic acid-binding protein